MNADDLVPIWPGEFVTWLVICARCKSREIGSARAYYENASDDELRQWENNRGEPSPQG